MFVLGIETSCDETAAAVLEGPRRILSNIVSSQLDLHHAYGGVVPELASRRHIEIIDEVVGRSLSEAGLTLQDVGLVAVTVGPGLAGALLVGVTFARAAAHVLHKPLAGINHIEAHLYAPVLEDESLTYPFVSLVVSGGHTLLVRVRSLGHYELLGTTRDDAAGEAFDKVAKLMGLGYPGGPVIDKMAASGNPLTYRFPRPMLTRRSSLNFSFSGLKTAVLYRLRGYGPHKMAPGQPVPGRLEDIAASVQEAIVDVLAGKALRALEATGCGTLAIGGGVAANSRLRARLTELSSRHGFKLYLPSRVMCTDNAAMIAGLAFAKYEAGLPGESLDTDPGLQIRNTKL